MSDSDSTSPVLVGSGDEGEPLMWEPGFEIIGAGCAVLRDLEDEDGGEQRLQRFVEATDYFRPLLALEFPPLYRQADLYCLEGFFVDVTDPEHDEIPGMSFNDVHVYLKQEAIQNVLAQFSRLVGELGKGDREPESLPPELIDAYRATDYVVLTVPELHVRVGSESPEVASLLQTHEAKAGAVITAWNPFGRLFSPEENARRNDDLLKRLSKIGWAWLPAEGRDLKGIWGAEASFFVLNVSRIMLDMLLCEFEQNAAVLVQKNGMAELVLHPKFRQ